MKILILSDSHSRLVDIDFNDYDYVICCGDYGRTELDGRAVYVRGNCDFQGEKEERIKIRNQKFYITHGDLYGVKYSYDRLVYKGMEEQARFVLFGHTHIQNIFEDAGITFINPGAYMDGFYAVLTLDKVIFYRYDEVIKTYDITW